jgi:hypothetical protein
MGAVTANPSALPYVAWSSATLALLPLERWDEIYASMQALKGHIQEYPGLQRFDAYAETEGDGVRLHCYTTWDTPEQLEVFLERGYTVDRMLREIAGIEPETTRVMEKIF